MCTGRPIFFGRCCRQVPHDRFAGERLAVSKSIWGLSDIEGQRSLASASAAPGKAEERAISIGLKSGL